MVLAEIIHFIVESVAGFLGVHGPLVGLVALALIAIVYGKELADLLTRLGRITRVAVVVAFGVLVTLSLGLFTGLLSLDGGIGAVGESLAQLLSGLL